MENNSSKVWTFGDSFSTNFDTYPSNVIEDYIKWKGYLPKTYAQIIANKLNMVHMNHARAGYDNYSILQKICEHSNEIKPNDLIIIGWTTPLRFRIINNSNEWVSMHQPFPKDFNETLLNDILINRLDNIAKYADEVNSWIKLIYLTFKTNKIIQWSWDISSKLNVNYFNGFETITQETNNQVRDGHYSENGHKELANKLIETYDIKTLI
jgi:hypothetical protein